MRDWAILLRTPRFRALWIALLCNNLSSWCVMAALPILVAQKYGAGTELVLSLGLRILPKFLLAPISSGLLRRFGSVRIAWCALAADAIATACLPWCDNFAVLQVAIAAIGSGIGLGLIGQGALNAMGRQPAEIAKLQTAMIIIGAFAEALTIYAFVTVFLLSSKI